MLAITAVAAVTACGAVALAMTPVIGLAEIATGIDDVEADGLGAMFALKGLGAMLAGVVIITTGCPP